MKSMIKKTFLTEMVLLLSLFTACGKQTAEEKNGEITSEYSVEEAAEDIESEPEPADATEPSIEEPDVILSPEEAFRAVLLSEMPFFYVENDMIYQNRNVIHEYYEYLNEVTYNDKPMATPNFAIVDMDGDTIPEVVLEIQDYCGFVILRYKEGQIYGSEISYRGLSDLKEDGSSMGSNSAFEYSYGKIFFIENTILHYDSAEIDYDSYYSFDIPIDEKTWEGLLSAHEEVPDVEWYEFSEESIEEWFTDNPAFADISPETMAVTIERQNYLDSLSYLIEITYDFSSRGEERVNVSPKGYYNSCYEEMDKIYRLCKEKLSDAELEELEENQRIWDEYLGQCMEKVMPDYFFYGDMVLRRTCYLINLYYGNHFYD